MNNKILVLFYIKIQNNYFKFKHFLVGKLIILLKYCKLFFLMNFLIINGQNIQLLFFNFIK